MEKNKKVTVCDVCKKETSEDINPLNSFVNESARNDWFRLFRNDPNRSHYCSGYVVAQRGWDLCSAQCLAKLIENDFTIKTESPTTFIKGNPVGAGEVLPPRLPKLPV